MYSAPGPGPAPGPSPWWPPAKPETQVAMDYTMSATVHPPSVMDAAGQDILAASAPSTDSSKAPGPSFVSKKPSAAPSGSQCPAGCMDLGALAKIMGIPWPCFCQVGTILHALSPFTEMECVLVSSMVA